MWLLLLEKKKEKEEEIYEQVPWVEKPGLVVPNHQRSIPDFIRELGWFPFAFLGMNAVLGKEIICMDAGLAYGLHFLTIATLAYVFLFDTVMDSFYAGAKVLARYHTNAHTLTAVSLKERVLAHKADVATEEFIKDLAHHWRASEIEAAKYNVLKAKHDARGEIIAQLETLQRKEKAVQSAGTKLIAHELREHVRELWTTPDRKLKDQALQQAINNLFNPVPVDPKDSPVYGLYLDYLRQTKGKQQARA